MSVTELKFKDGDDGPDGLTISHIGIKVVGNGFVITIEDEEEELVSVASTTDDLLEQLKGRLK